MVSNDEKPVHLQQRKNLVRHFGIGEIFLQLRYPDTYGTRARELR
jgi:hypothetical protein